MRLNKFLITVALTMLMALVLHFTAYAQQSSCKDLGIVRAQITSGIINVVLGGGVTPKDGLANIARWRIVKISTGIDPIPPTITGVTVRGSIGPGSTGSYFVDVAYFGTFEPKKTYAIYIDNLTFDGCDPGKEAFTTTSYKPAPAPGSTATPTQYELAKAKARTDADLYVEGKLEGVKGETAVKTIDLKFQIPLSISVIQKDNLLIGYIDLKASSNKKADADSLKIGAILRSGANLSTTGYFRGLVWDLDGRIEGNKNLRFINGIVGNKFSLTTRVIDLCGSRCNLYFQPFAGLEVGRNMRTPVQQARGQNIVRPLIGATGILAFPIKRRLLDSISLQSEYIRRWSLTSEVGVDKDGDNYIPIYAGRGPRDYIQTKLEFGFNDFFGLAIGHEYGSLPPNFKLLDNKYSVGLTFKSLLMKRPK